VSADSVTQRKPKVSLVDEPYVGPEIRRSSTNTGPQNNQEEQLSTPPKDVSQSDNAQSTQEEVHNRPSENASGNHEKPVEKVSIVMERKNSLETPEKQVSI
jgi:hypothetical protein